MSPGRRYTTLRRNSPIHQFNRGLVQVRVRRQNAHPKTDPPHCPHALQGSSIAPRTGECGPASTSLDPRHHRRQDGDPGGLLVIGYTAQMGDRSILHELIDTLPDGAVPFAHSMLERYQNWPPPHPERPLPPQIGEAVRGIHSDRRQLEVPANGQLEFPPNDN